MSLNTIDVKTLQTRLADGTAVLIDIRDQNEYAREHIVGSRLVPADTLDAHEFDADSGKLLVFCCQSGMRTVANAARILNRAPGEVCMLDGGLEAWKRAGLPYHEDRSQPLPIMRQVQIAAGTLVLLGVVLGFLVAPAWFGLSGFVGAGLLFAGLTGFCGMANLLALMPWNKPRPSNPQPAQPAA